MNLSLLIAVAAGAAVMGFVVCWIWGARSREALAAAQASLASLDPQLASLARELDTARAQMTKSEIAHREQATLRATAEAQAARMPELERVSSELRRLAADQQSELGNLRARVEEQLKALAEKQSRIASITDETVALNSDLVATKQSLSRTSAELAAERENVVAARSELDRTSEQLRVTLEARSELEIRSTDLATRLDAERRHSAEKLRILEDAKQALTDQFRSLANDILEEKSRKFSEQNQAKLGQLLDPVKTKLSEFQTKVEAVYVSESKDRSALGEQVKQLLALNHTLSEDAKSLTQALKGSSKTQGSWGELILERLLEASGLRKGEEYEVQASHTREDGSRAQPDVLIRLPEQRDLVVDSKVSLRAYEESVSAQTEEEREVAIQRHILAVRAHIKGLSAKEYQKLYQLNSLDCVLMFIPLEPAFMVAVTHDRDLFMDAWDRNVILVSPSTLMFVIRTVAQLWRQEAQSRNAKEIADRGAELYNRLVNFVTDLEKVGERIHQAQESYVSARGRLVSNKGSVIWQAEKLKQLGVKPSKQLPPAVLAQATAEDDEANLRITGEDDMNPSNLVSLEAM